VSAEQKAKKQIPIVPFLKLPENGARPYLAGSRCPNCGETYLGERAICLACGRGNGLEEVALSQGGELFTYTVVYQSAPWVPVPYIAAVVKLPEGPVVRASLTGIEPRPELLRAGMALELVTETVRADADGNEVVAYKFRPKN